MGWEQYYPGDGDWEDFVMLIYLQKTIKTKRKCIVWFCFWGCEKGNRGSHRNRV